MQVRINGEHREVPTGLSLAELVTLLGLAERRLAVEVNQDLVPRGRFGEHHLNAGDCIEIVQAIGGG
jgi:sulfur carrier protein